MIKLNILGHDWKIFTHEADDFCRKYDESDAAFTLPAEKEIHFNLEELTLIVTKHELWHAFRAEMCTSSALLSAEQEEEVSAELFANNSDKILRIARHLYKEIKNA
jgi:hypothetical protein